MKYNLRKVLLYLTDFSTLVCYNLRLDAQQFLQKYIFQRRGSKVSLNQFNDSSKNLTALGTNVSHNSTQSTIISESEARTIACDFDYGVQVQFIFLLVH